MSHPDKFPLGIRSEQLEKKDLSKARRSKIEKYLALMVSGGIAIGGAALGYELKKAREEAAQKTDSSEYQKQEEEPKELNPEAGEELLKKIYEDGKNNGGANTEGLIIDYFGKRFPPGMRLSPRKILEMIREIESKKETFADEVLGDKNGETDNKEKAALEREFHENPGLKQLVELENRVEKIIKEKAGKKKDGDGEKPEKKYGGDGLDRT